MDIDLPDFEEFSARDQKLPKSALGEEFFHNPLVPHSFFDDEPPVLAKPKRRKRKTETTHDLIPGVLAIDIDIERITAYSSTKQVVQDGGNTLPIAEMLAHDIVLVETGSPYIYGDPNDKGNQFHRLRWLIYNIARSKECHTIKPNALFAPSSEWTMKYPEKAREAMAGVTGKFNHDIRACICMIYFYGLDKKLWVPWESFMGNIINAKRS
jgi:hypothetical protein